MADLDRMSRALKAAHAAGDTAAATKLAQAIRAAQAGGAQVTAPAPAAPQQTLVPPPLAELLPPAEAERARAERQAQERGPLFQVGRAAQTLGRGLSKAALLPEDLIAVGMNALAFIGEKGANAFLSDENEISIPRTEMPSEFALRQFGNIGRDLGVEPISDEQFTSTERVQNRAVETAIETAFPSAMIARGLMAPARPGAATAGAALDPLTAKATKEAIEKGGAGRVFAMDAAAGAGAGAALQGLAETGALEGGITGNETADTFLKILAPMAAATGGNLAAGGGAAMAEGLARGTGNTLLDAIDSAFRVNSRDAVWGADEGVAAAARNPARAPSEFAHAFRSVLEANPNPRPVNPETGEKYSRNALDLFAQFTQDAADNPQLAARNIRDAADDFASGRIRREGDEDLKAPPVSARETPTVGQLTGDRGLASMERTARDLDPTAFMRRDDSRFAKIDELSQETVPAGARAEDFTQDVLRQAQERRDAANTENAAATTAAQAKADAAMRQADDSVAAAQAKADEARKAATAEAEAFAAGRSAETQRAAAGQIDETVASTYKARRDEKNAAFEAAKTEGRGVDVSAEGLQSARASVEAKANADTVSDAAGAVRNSGPIRRIRDLATFDEKTGEMVDPGSLTAEQAIEIRKGLAADISEARKAGKYQLADNLKTLKSAIDSDLDAVADSGGAPILAQAKKTYNERFAPIFRRGKGDPASDFGSKYNLDPTTRTTAPPSQTAKTFLQQGQPEKAASLRRVIEASDDPKKATASAREYLLSDLVMSGAVGKDGALNAGAVQRWRAKWGDQTLNEAVPGFAGEIAALYGKADKTRANMDQIEENLKASSGAAKDAKRSAERTLQGEIKAAQDKLRASEAELNQGAFRAVLENSGREAAPEKAVAAIFSSRNPKKTAEEVVALVESNPRAKDGLKAAIQRYIRKEDRDPRESGATPREVGANLKRLVKRYEETLSAIYSPEEMNKLRMAHKLMEGDARIRTQANAGSPTAERKEAVKQWERVMEAGLKLKFGVLKGGGILRSLRIAGQSLPGNTDAQIESLRRQMFLDPALAAHILSRDADPDSANWNKRLQALVNLGETAEFVQDEK